MIEDLLDTEVVAGKAVTDLLTLEFLASIFGSVLSAIVVLVIGFAISGWVKRRINGLAARNAHLDDTAFDFLANIARYAILAITFLIVLNSFGVQTTSVVAMVGAAGLAIGLALQGTLSNVAAGVMIIMFRPFKNGDFIEVAGESGTVKSINLNNTELASLSNVQIIIPNKDVWGNTITNYSVYDTRRAEWTFGVGYGANLAEAQRIIRDTIMADPRARAEPEPFVQVRNLGESSVDFLVRVWVDSADYFAFSADMTRAVKEALDEGGIDIPFPTRTVMQAAT